MRTVTRNIFFLLLVAAVFLVGVEFSFRVLVRAGMVDYPPPPPGGVLHAYTPVPGLIYEMRPNAQVPDGAEEYTNSFGMRGPACTVEKPEGVLRVCVIGDSVAYGWRLPYGQTFAALLEKDILARGIPCEVLNFSVSGYCSSQEEVVLRQKALAFGPDVLIIAFCHNDNTIADGMRGLDSQMSPYSLGGRLHSRFVSFLMDRYEKSSAERRKNYGQTESLFRAAARLGKEKGFVSIVLDFPYYFNDFAAYELRDRHELVNSMARDCGLAVLDFGLLWKDMPKEERGELFKDKLHLSAKGMESAAAEIIGLMEEKGLLNGPDD